MPSLGYFLRLSGLAVLGLLALAVGFVIFIFLFPYLAVAGMTALLAALMFITLCLVIYLALVIGAAIVYFFRPMEVSKKKKGYSLKRTKEAGRRKKN